MSPGSLALELQCLAGTLAEEGSHHSSEVCLKAAAKIIEQEEKILSLPVGAYQSHFNAALTGLCSSTSLCAYTQHREEHVAKVVQVAREVAEEACKAL